MCDFRSTSERTREPPPFKTGGEMLLSAFDYELDYSGMSAFLQARTRDEAISGFAASYAGFAKTLSPQFKDMFERLLRRETPIAFNCTAGKDRTGLASALILSALGVARADIVADYALSETYVPPDTYLAGLKGEGAAASSMGAAERDLFSRLPEDVVRVILGTPPQVMEQTLARFDQDYGGPLGFLKQELGIGELEVEYLRSVYLA